MFGFLFGETKLKPSFIVGWDMMGQLPGLLKAYDLLVESKDLLVSVYPT